MTIEYQYTVLIITYGINEALFLTDRLLMMTNEPAANIGEVLDIPFARPRVGAAIVKDPQTTSCAIMP